MVFENQLCSRRLGPSASEAAATRSEKDKEVFANQFQSLVDALQTIKSLTRRDIDDRDPMIRNVLYMYAPNLLDALDDDAEEQWQDEQQEVVRAKRGLPTSARPMLSSKEKAEKVNKSIEKGEKVDKSIEKGEKVDKSVEKGEKVDKSSENVEKLEEKGENGGSKSPASSLAVEPSEKEKPINSASHRASHARLSRKMASLDPAQFPHMTKLWSGNRKDWYSKMIFKFFPKKFTNVCC